MDRPYRFWVNNDRDDVDPEIGEVADLNPSDQAAQDAADATIRNLRDLEDFGQLAIRLPPQFDPTDPSIRVELAYRTPLSGTEIPSIRLYKAAAPDDSYLHQHSVGRSQVDTYGQAVALLTATPVALDRTMFATPDRTAHFVFEGFTSGCGVVSVRVTRSGTEVATDTAHLCLYDITSFYDHYTSGDNIALNLHTLARVHDANPEITASASADYVLFIHGWRMPTWERRAFAQTAFKRLWHYGYRGQFGMFSWPTAYTPLGLRLPTLAELLFPTPALLLSGYWPQAVRLNYAYSEYVAWQSGGELRTYLRNLSQRGLPQRRLNVRVVAHSMGNFVASEAFRLEANSPLPRTLASTYVATQAATPATAYDRLLGDDWYSYNPPVLAGRPYFERLRGAVDNIINLFNPSDPVLALWHLSNANKPDFGYSAPAHGRCETGSRILAFPADSYEMFAACARAASRPLGATPGVSGPVSRSVSLTGAFGYGFARTDHSAQFMEDIVKRGPYWGRLLDELAILRVRPAECLPASPSGLAASVSGNLVRLSWTPAGGDVTSQMLDVGSAPGLQDLGSLPLSASESGVEGRVPDGRYHLAVRAINACGSGPTSSELIVDVPDCGMPAAPSSLTYTLANRQVSLAWNAAASAASYRLEVGYQPGLANVLVENVGAATTFGGPAPPGVYYARVRGVNACGVQGPVSNEIVVAVN